nr:MULTISPECIES: LysR family transcriptional regulator [unclassified Mycolicibacterium]
MRSFATVAASESYEAAAVALNKAQPTVWKQVSSLSEELGLSLFEKGTVIPTTQGRELLGATHKVLVAYHDFVTEADRLRNGVIGEVRVACYPAQVNYFLAEAAGKFKAKFPDARVVLAEFTQAGTKGLEHLDKLEEGTVDLAVGPKRDNLGGIKIYESRIVVVLPENHPRRNADVIGPDELQDEPLLVAPRGYHSREEIDRAFEKAGLRPKIETESSSWMALLALGTHGVGVPIVPDDTLQQTSAQAYPAFRSAEGNPLVREWWLQWRRREELQGAGDRFIQFVEQFVKSRQESLPRG